MMDRKQSNDLGFRALVQQSLHTAFTLRDGDGEQHFSLLLPTEAAESTHNWSQIAGRRVPLTSPTTARLTSTVAPVALAWTPAKKPALVVATGDGTRTFC